MNKPQHAAPRATHKPMKISQVHPDLQSAYRFQPPLPAHRPAVVRLANKAIGLLKEPKPLDGVIRRVHRVAASGMEVRVFYPDSPVTDQEGRSAALLWIHGGGMIFGAAIQDDVHCMLLASTLNILVVSVEYRLAPGAPYPAALDDCQDAWEWMVSNARNLSIDPARIAIGGQSAGGGLAASLVNRLHDTDATPQPRAQWLLSPMLDERTAARTELDGRNHFLWTNRANRHGWSSYLNIPAAELGTASPPPGAVPARRSTFEGLPPTWIGVGTIDLFHDEDAAYARDLQRSGVDTTFITVEGAPHGFEFLDMRAPVSVGHLRQAYSWLEQQLELN